MADDSDITLPWHVGGIRRQDGSTLMVEIEVDTLLGVYEHAKLGAEVALAHELKRSPQNTSRSGPLRNSIAAYDRMIGWLKRLNPDRPWW